MPITDAHTHVWTDDPVRYPEPHPRPAYMYRRRYEPADFFAQAGPAGVNRAVLVQSDNFGQDHRYIADLIRDQPAVLAGIARVPPLPAPATFAPHSPSASSSPARATLERLAAQGFRGFRIVALGADAPSLLRNGAAGFAPYFRAAAELPRAAICALIDPVALPAIRSLCSNLPGVTVVIDHLARIGLSNRFDEADIANLLALAACPRICVKVSAFWGLGSGRPPHLELAPLIRRVFDAFGPDRLLWGSDCPYQTQHEDYRDAVALIQQGLPFLGPADRDAILHRTADRLFFDLPRPRPGRV